MPRSPKLDLTPLLGALADSSEDPTTDAILDAAMSVLTISGLRRCTVEQIAERAAVGRTTIYRRFTGRDEIIHAVMARELRQFLTAVSSSVEHLDRVEDKVVQGFLSGLAAVRSSELDPMMRSDPDLLMFLISDSGPALELVTRILVNQLELAVEPQQVDTAQALHAAELVFRLGVSFALTPNSTFPFDDDDAAAHALHRLFDPILKSSMR